LSPAVRAFGLRNNATVGVQHWPFAGARAARDHYGASFATASSSWTISAGKNGQLPDFRMLGGTGRALKQASLRFGKQPAKAITAYLGHASIQRRSTSTVT
jgi:hypothetical protein